MKVRVVITTYNRPELLRATLQQLRDQETEHELDVYVYDDCSTTALPDMDGATLVQFDKRHGKVLYWYLVDGIFQDAACSGWDRFFWLPDDCDFDRDAVQRISDLWEGIKDARKACLNPLVDSRGHIDQWGEIYEPVRCGDVWRIGWNDCCMWCERECLGVLDYEIRKVPETWWDNTPWRSSGVGWQITDRLRRMGRTMYQADEAILRHVGTESKMNPWRHAIL